MPFLWPKQQCYSIEGIITLSGLTAIFPGGPRLAGTRMSPFWILLELRTMEVVVTAGPIRRAKLQSNCHHQQTNTHLFRGLMPSCRSTNSVRDWREYSIEGTMSYNSYPPAPINSLAGIQCGAICQSLLRYTVQNAATSSERFLNTIHRKPSTGKQQAGLSLRLNSLA